LALELPIGAYRAGCVNTKTDKVEKQAEIKPLGHEYVLSSPRYADDIALRIMQTTKK
jgi:hypothetical protein